MALPLVLIIVTCIMIVAFGFLTLFTARARLNASNIRNNTSDYVAEVGLYQYLWNLNQNDNFYKNNPTLAGYYAEANGYYYVSATSPNPPANPYLALTCTGWRAIDPNNKYSFTAQVVKRTFTQFAWCTNSEDTAGTPTPVYWVSGDVAHGPIFTNGIFYFSGAPTFNGVVEYAGNGGTQSCYYDTGSAPNFLGPPPEPDLVQTMAFPTSNSELLTWSNPSNGGYYLNGRTSIYLHSTTMNVFNYDCNQYILNGLTPTSTLNPNYHTWVKNMGQTQSLPLPADGVIYVDGAQDANYNDNNTNTEEAGKFAPTTGNAFVSGTLQGQLTVAAANNIYITGADPTSGPPANPHTSGGVTYATTTFDANGNVVNVGSNDMLGLVTNNYVMILRYGWPAQNSQGYTNGSTDYSPYDVNLDAAVMAVSYSWQYEGWWNYNPPDPEDKINLEGSIIQNYRGPVGMFSGNTIDCGYNKNYYHDARMNTENPPHFLDPTTSGWGILTWRRIVPPTISWTQVTGVTVASQGGAASVYAGQTLQMSATVSPANASIQTVVWSVANFGGANASIDPNVGLLDAGTHNGTVVVTATSQDVSKASASMSITINIIPVASVTVASQGGATSVYTGQTLQMSATVSPADASIQTVVWSVANSGGANASIDPNTGLLTAGTNAGTATVTATSTDGYATSLPYTISITVRVSGITVAGYGGAISVLCGSGNTLQMTAIITPKTASNPAVTWSVTNSGGTNATISGTGLLSAGTQGGTVTVTATANDGSGVVGSASITIFVPVIKITVAGRGGATSVGAYNTLQMIATVTPATATNPAVTWSVADSGGANATISGTGLLTAGTNAGTATVKATSTDGTNISGSATITIFIPVTKITVTSQGGATTLKHSGHTVHTLQMIATVTPANASNPAVTWSVVNSGGSNATISSTGLLTSGTGTGTAMVKATSTDGANVTGTMSITIY